MRSNFSLWLIALTLISLAGCQAPEKQEESFPVQLVTLDPGHFHAALVQKTGYATMDTVVHVYAPDGPDVQLHLDRIERFNARPELPTSWHEITYTGDDFFEKMLEEKAGNVVMLAGNNQKKTEYILEALKNDFHVLADKPMAINTDDFETLKEAFQAAAEKNLLLYDIMTERFEISTMLQKELSQIPEIFGSLEKGDPENPSITKESVHHFFKYVSGNPLVRPPWFMDVEQEGEGIVDVTTHLVDLIQWEAFPEQIIDYENEVDIYDAKRWPTNISQEQFNAVTGLDTYPAYLEKYVTADNSLDVYCNGEINYKLKDIHARVSVTWAYQAPEGGGDTHYSIMRGTKANLIIRQGSEQSFVPTLYIEPVEGQELNGEAIEQAFAPISIKYPGVNLAPNENGYIVNIPDSYREGHEAHFGQVTENFLQYLLDGNMPAWEVPNMIAKYYITTQALEKAMAATPEDDE